MGDYQQAFQADRPRRAHRFDVFSHKLGRALTLFSYRELSLWVLLESSPITLKFCERPAILIDQKGKPLLADFWVQSSRRERFLVFVDDDVNTPKFISPPAAVGCITRKSIEAHACWINNWRSMLPYIISHRRWITEKRITRAVTQCSAPMTLGQLEQSLSDDGEPATNRALIFAAIAAGRLRSNSLRLKQWGFNTVIEPTRHGH